VLVGHSMGSLIALEAAFQAPARVAKLGLVGTTYPMKVADALLATARDDEPRAIDMVNAWSHSSLAHKPSVQAPGFYLMNSSRRLMQRLSAINPHQLFYTDFSACNNYANGAVAAASVACPTLFLLGSKDIMTPPKSTTAFTASIAHASIVTVAAGHDMMSEAPDAVLDALMAFANLSAD
jgi:pimeloyl-ACP methyl ester carboxylesterase